MEKETCKTLDKKKTPAQGTKKFNQNEKKKLYSENRRCEILHDEERKVGYTHFIQKFTKFSNDSILKIDLRVAFDAIFFFFALSHQVKQTKL